MTLFGWAALALPVVAFRYFPTQDGPAHLNTGLLLSALSSEPSPLVARYFEVRPVPFANQLGSWLIAGAAHLVPAAYAESLVWTMVFGGFAAAVTVNLALMGATAFAPLLFVIAAGSLTHFGFLNFVIALTLFAQTVFVVQRGLGHASPGWVLAVVALSGATYVAHPLAGLGLAAAECSFAAGYLALGGLAAWPPGREPVRVSGGFSWLVVLACGLAGLLLLLLAVHDAWPQIVRLLDEAASSSASLLANALTGDGPLDRLARLVSSSYLVSYSAIDFVFAGLLSFTIAWLAWRWLRTFLRGRRVLLTDSWLAAVVTLALLVMFVPRRFESFLPDRLSACFFILVIAWLAGQELDRAAARRLLAIGLALNVGLLAWRLDRTIAVESILAEYATVAAALPPGASVLGIESPKELGHRCLEINVGALPCRFQPTAHFLGRAVVGRGVAWLSNYQFASEAGYFPVTLRAPWNEFSFYSLRAFDLRWDTPDMARKADALVRGLCELLERDPVDIIVVWDDGTALGKPDQAFLSGIAPLLSRYEKVFVSQPRGAARVYRHL